MDHPGRVIPPSLVNFFFAIMSTTKVTINEAPSSKPGCGGNSKATGKKARKARKQQAKQEVKEILKEMPKGGRKKTAKKMMGAMYKEFDYTKPHPQLAIDYMHKTFGKQQLSEMAGDLDSLFGNLVKKFAAMQMNPATVQCQVPDSDFRDSAIVTSTMVVDLEVDMTATSGGVPGQFAFLVQPKLGNFGDPHKYKLAYVDPTKMSQGDQSANDYTSTGPYKITDTVAQTDLRIDPTFYELTQGPPGSARFTGGSASAIPAHPFGSTANMVATAASANLGIKYDGSSATGTWQFPQGSFLVYAQVTCPAAITAFNFNGSSTATPLEFFGNGLGVYGVLWRIDVPSPQLNQFSFTVTTAALTVTSSTLTVVTTVFDDAAVNSGSGAIASYRSAAMSVTVTPTVTAFDKGGQMAAALLPNCDANKRFFTNTPPGPEGSLRSFEAVSMLANKKGIRNFEEGLFAWWTQLSSDDYKYQDPTDMDLYEPPTIVVAGRWQPSVGSSPTGKYVIGKITIVYVLEFLTEDQSFRTNPSPGSQAIIDAVHAFYISGNDGLPFEQVLGNPEHISWWRRVIGFLKSAAIVTGDVLKVAGPVLAAL